MLAALFLAAVLAAPLQAAVDPTYAALGRPSSSSST
jgi:hypothetical protein